MGMCKPSGGKTDLFGPFKSNIHEARQGKPNSRTDLYDIDTGELLQQRWYGQDFIDNAKIGNEYVRDIWDKVDDPSYI